MKLHKFLLIAGLLLTPFALAQTPASTRPTPAEIHEAAVPSHDATWWKHAVIYEIYPRSYQDTNGDGVGDLNGITQRMDYLQHLGVDAIWISPMYPSPQVDFGYDISNYEAVDPQYGTMADFDKLMASAKQHNVRVLLDTVLAAPPQDRARIAGTLADLYAEVFHLQYHAKSALPFVEAIAERFDD